MKDVSQLQAPSFFTFVLERWLGSSLDCSAPAPSVGSWVWKTVMRPPVEDMSLKAACSAGPRALWVSVLWLNMAGREVSRSFTSCRREEREAGSRSPKQAGTTEESKEEREYLLAFLQIHHQAVMRRDEDV